MFGKPKVSRWGAESPTNPAPDRSASSYVSQNLAGVTDKQRAQLKRRKLTG